MSQNENIYGSNVTGAKANQNQSTQSNINALGNARSAGYMAAGDTISGLADNYIAYNARQQGANTNAPVVGTKQKRRPNAMVRTKMGVARI